MKAIALFFACLFSIGAYAQWVDRQNKPLAESEDRKSDGRFGAQLIFTTDEQTLFKKWATPSETVDLKPINSVRINQPVSAFIVFGGCKPNWSGNCSVSVRFKVLQPDGKVYTETPMMEVWHNRPAPRGRSLELSAEYLKVMIEPHELRGPYVVQSHVHDNNSGAVLLLRKTFNAIDSEEQKVPDAEVKGTPASVHSSP